MDAELTILGSLKIYQPKNGYRFSNEPFVLMKDIVLKDRSVFLDYGSGSGIISILAGKINKNLTIRSVEANPDMIELIKKNVKINNVKNIDVVDNIETIKTNSIDIVVSNPPYFVDNLYRKSRKFYMEKFESITIDEFIKNIRRVIKNKGMLKMSYHSTRMVNLIKKLDTLGFGIKSITPVYGNKTRHASFVIIESQFAAKSHTILKKAIYLEEFLYF